MLSLKATHVADPLLQNGPRLGMTKDTTGPSNVWDWINSLYNLCRRPNGNREVGNILGDHASSPNGATFTDRNTRHDGHIASYPAVILDGDWTGVLDGVSP